MQTMDPAHLPGLIQATLGIYAAEAAPGAPIPREVAALADRPRLAEQVRQWSLVVGALGLDIELISRSARQVVDVTREVPTEDDRANGFGRGVDIYSMSYAKAPATRKLKPGAFNAAVCAAVKTYVAARTDKIATLGSEDVAVVRELGDRPVLERAIRAVVESRGIAALEIQVVCGVSARTARCIVTATRPVPVATIAAILDSYEWLPTLVVGKHRIPCRWGLGEMKPAKPVTSDRNRARTLLRENA